MGDRSRQNMGPDGRIDRYSSFLRWEEEYIKSGGEARPSSAPLSGRERSVEEGLEIAPVAGMPTTPSAGGPSSRDRFFSSISYSPSGQSKHSETPYMVHVQQTGGVPRCAFPKTLTPLSSPVMMLISKDLFLL